MAYKFPPMYKAKDAKGMSRTYQLICYPESLPSPIDDVMSQFNLDRGAYILHDADFTPEGEPKKPHYHVYIKNKNPVRVQTVADRFGVKVEQIPAFKNIDTAGMIEYWLHENADDKALYEPEKVVTVGCSVEDMRKGKKQGKEDETVMVRKVMEIVKQMISEGNFDNFELIERCCAAGCYSAYRRDSSFRRYLENAAVRATESGPHLPANNGSQSLGDRIEYFTCGEVPDAPDGAVFEHVRAGIGLSDDRESLALLWDCLWPGFVNPFSTVPADFVYKPEKAVALCSAEYYEKKNG